MAQQPRITPLLKEVEAELGFELDRELKIKVTQDVASTLAHIAKDDGLKHEFAGHPQAVIDAGVKQYVKELVQGKKYGPEDARLTALFTVEPVEVATTAPTPAEKPAVAPAKSTRLSHLLQDPEYMQIFVDEIQKAAKSPGDAGFKAAQIFKDHIGTPQKEVKVLRVMQDLELMQDTSGKRTPARYAQSNEGLDRFRQTLRRHGMERGLTDMVEDGKPSAEKRHVISRRGFLGAAATAGLAATAYALHGRADDNVKEATGVVTQSKKEEEVKIGPGGFFDNAEDPAAKFEEPVAQEKIKKAQEYEGGMMIAGAAAGAAALYTMRQVIRRAWRADKDEFRQHAREVLRSLDPVVEAATAKIATGEGRG